MAEVFMTLHARFRWLERVERRNIGLARRQASEVLKKRPARVTDAEIVAHILRQTGRTDCDLDAEIMSPVCRAALNCGAKYAKIKSGAFKLVFEARRVITVLDNKRSFCPTKKMRREQLNRRLQP